MSSRVYTLSRAITLEVLECAECGTPFGVAQKMLDQRRVTGTTFYCPDGHGNCYTSEVDQLRQDLARKTHELDQMQARARDLQTQRDIYKRNATTTQRELTRTQTRIKNGMCPLL
jgi:septal ring factor EnvC (AmiA/AmiB activator)